jgi:alkylation response protein AidB-like acyl-CoA dehydrogenase
MVTQNAVSQGRTPERMHAAMTKLFSARVAQKIIDEALQIHGAQGYQQGSPVEYLYRVVRRWRMAGGTDEIQRNNIAKVLKKHGMSALY